MGLDMYAYAVEKNMVISDTEFNQSKNAHQFFDWRKNRHIHNWMEHLYKERGGSLSFNLIPLRLYSSDLDNLEADIKRESLSDAAGFFFGSNTYDKNNQEYDLTFIADAREHIKNGFAVYYDSWW